MHYTDAQMLTKIDALFDVSPKYVNFIPVERLEVL
jgi:hypothetical protein